MTRRAEAGRPVRWDWRYQNRTSRSVELWVALPPDLPSQPAPRVVATQPSGFAERAVTASGPNRVAYLTVSPGEEARLTVEAVVWGGPVVRGGPGAPGASVAASDYLGSSALIRVDDETRTEASTVIAGVASPVERARRLFLHVLRTCRYAWPPAERGSASMRVNRRGDCGEYSFLYAALCRSVGLPCRVLIGTLLGRRMRPHAWNEVYLADAGWVGVDARLTDVVLGRLAARGREWAAGRLEHRFGRPRCDRFAFSVDPCVPLAPPFADRPVPEAARTMTVAGRRFAWGFEALDGTAPYFQPCYVGLHGDPVPERTDDYVGRWSLTRR